MPMLRTLIVLLTCLTIALGSPPRAQAALLGSPESIPADALVVLSVANTQALWPIVKQTPLHQGIKNMLDIPAIRMSEDFQSLRRELAATGKKLGISLEPDDFFTKTLLGADLALGFRQGSEDPDVLLVLKFADAKHAEAFLKQIESTANDSRTEDDEDDADDEEEGGDAIGSGIIYQTIADQKVLVVPGEGLWACTRNGSLLVSSSADMMSKALRSTALDNLSKAPAVRRGLEALGDPKTAHGFFHIDYVGILRAIAEHNPDMRTQIKALEGMATIQLTGVLEVAPDALRLRTFLPNASTDPAVRELATKFPPSEIAIGRLIPTLPLLATTFNNFDGPRLLDVIVEQLARVAEMGSPQATGMGSKSQVKMMADHMIEQTEQNLGFKIREDLLVSIGPEGALLLENFSFNPIMGTLTLDLALAFQIRDLDKLNTVLDKLEAFLTQKLPAMTGGAPATKTAMKELAFDNAKGKSIAPLPHLPTILIGWVVVENKYLVLGASERVLQNTARAYADPQKSLKASPAYRKVVRHLPATTNSEVVVGVRPILDLAVNLARLMTPHIFQGEEGQILNAGLEVAKTVETFHLSTRLNANADLIATAVLQMTPATPPAAPPPAAEPAKTEQEGAGTPQ